MRIVRRLIEPKSGSPSIGLYWSEIKRIVPIEEERSLKAGILQLGGKSNHPVLYNKDVRKSVLIPRDIEEEEILKKIDEGRSHIIQADIGSYLVW